MFDNKDKEKQSFSKSFEKLLSVKQQVDSTFQEVAISQPFRNPSFKKIKIQINLDHLKE